MCQGIVLRDEHSEVGQLRAIGIVIGIGNKKKKFRFALVVRTVAFITIVKQSLLMASLHFNKRKFLERTEGNDGGETELSGATSRGDQVTRERVACLRSFNLSSSNFAGLDEGKGCSA